MILYRLAIHYYFSRQRGRVIIKDDIILFYLAAFFSLFMPYKLRPFLRLATPAES